MSKAASKPAHWRLRRLNFVFEATHRAIVKNEEADALLRLSTVESDTKTLKNKISVKAIFNQGQTQNGIVGDDIDEGDCEIQWRATNKSCLYVPVILAQTEANQEDPPTPQQLLEARYLDSGCLQTCEKVYKRRGTITWTRTEFSYASGHQMLQNRYTSQSSTAR